MQFSISTLTSLARRMYLNLQFYTETVNKIYEKLFKISGKKQVICCDHGSIRSDIMHTWQDGGED